MAANYTEHYQLNQWEPEDKVLRTDFNADNLKIDGALVALAEGKANQETLNSLSEQVTALDGRALRWAVGSYTGTGTYGSDSPCTLNFSKSLGRAPVFFMVRRESDYSTTKNPVLAAVRGIRSCSVYPSLINTARATCYLTWSGTSVSWYGEEVEVQMNADGVKYIYFAVG